LGEDHGDGVGNAVAGIDGTHGGIERFFDHGFLRLAGAKNQRG